MKRIVFVAMLILWGGPSWAATINVTTFADQNDGAAPCSLREAILSANGDSDQGGCTHAGIYGADTIILSAGTYTLSIASNCEDDAADGDLDITDALVITGAGADPTPNGMCDPGATCIDANDIDRVFDIPEPGVIVEMTDLVIQDGTANTCDGPLGDGGGIRVQSDSSVSLAELTLRRVVVRDNEAATGGGIYNLDIATIIDSTVNGNRATSDGGGIANYYSNSVEDNQTFVINSTISGNTADGFGGGISADGYGDVHLRNATVTLNTADADASGSGEGGGISIPDGGGPNELLIRNSILAGNSDNSAGSQTPDCYMDSATVTSEDFNLIGDETGCDGLFTGGSDQVGTGGSPVNPRLGPLANNGGPTPTHALLTAPVVSPAIDTANSNGCFSNDANNGGLLNTDQRGSPRPRDGGLAGPSPARCDIGAFELGGCGDGFLLSPEVCDDGNLVNGDGCNDQCQVEACGNGVLDAGEECDDGNATDGDGCNASCELEACGDGVVQTSEGCDDGNAVDGDGCSAACVLESCGDGVVQPAEECDDGNDINTDACLNTCRDASCGDGFLQTTVEECDDGNTEDGDGCTSACAVDNIILLLGDGGCGLVASTSPAGPWGGAANLLIPFAILALRFVSNFFPR